MTDMTTTTFVNTRPTSVPHIGVNSFQLDETHWGYAVITNVGAARSLIIMQTVSMIMGAAFLAAAIGMWLLPAASFGAGPMDMRLFTTIVFGALAALFLWYGTRGVMSQIHFDTSRGEIREVARSRSGKHTVIGCYGFDTVASVGVEPSGDPAEINLVLRYRNQDEALIIATGRAADVAALQERISRDVVIAEATPDHV